MFVSRIVSDLSMYCYFVLLELYEIKLVGFVVHDDVTSHL